MKKPRLLDSFALMAFLGRESGFERVRALLREAEASGEPALMNEINVGEVYYLTAKKRSSPRPTNSFISSRHFPSASSAIPSHRSWRPHA